MASQPETIPQTNFQEDIYLLQRLGGEIGQLAATLAEDTPALSGEVAYVADRLNEIVLQVQTTDVIVDANVTRDIYHRAVVAADSQEFSKDYAVLCSAVGGIMKKAGMEVVDTGNPRHHHMVSEAIHLPGASDQEDIRFVAGTVRTEMLPHRLCGSYIQVLTGANDQEWLSISGDNIAVSLVLGFDGRIIPDHNDDASLAEVATETRDMYSFVVGARQALGID